MTNLFYNYKNAVIAVALSGGKDSMCLLDLLLKAQKTHNLTVKAVNIDHSIRGKDSERDSNFVKDYCKKVGVELRFFKVDALSYSKENNLTLEEGARALRYQVFDSLLNENFADYIATAHHLSDNFETVLLNLFRGTGVKGLTGIPKKRDKFIRPLLELSRQDIDSYVIKNNIPFVTDDSNFDNNYTRNYLRNEIIPKILEKFPSSETSISRLTKIVKDEDEYLDSLALSHIENANGKYYLNNSLSPVLFKRATKIILNNLGIKKDYESVHLDDAFKLTSLSSGSKITLPKNVVAVKEYDKIAFFCDENEIAKEVINYTGKTFTFLGKTYEISDKKLDNALLFDGDKIPKNAVIRSKKDGDIFKKFGGGRKKLKDYLIDKKIPRIDRNKIPLLAVDNNILLIFGVEISDDIKVTSKTTNLLYTK